MRKVREILRLTFGVEPKLTQRAIARSCNISPSTVGDCLLRFSASGLSWPLPEDLADDVLENRLYPERARPNVTPPIPEWKEIHREMRRKGVTLSLLWQEFKQRHPDAYEYSWFCEAYARFCETVEPVMRQTHKLGEKCFVDYAGPTFKVMVNAQTGEVRDAYLFVGVLGASNYTYAEATWSQSSANWLRSHVRMFNFFGGCPEIVVPDNLKSGVTKPDYYEPDENVAYAELAEHYGVAVIPTRVRRPKDKAKVEKAVQDAERAIMAPLRDRIFYSLDELNEAIAEKLHKHNARPFQKLPGSRLSVFLEQERSHLRALPAEPYSCAQWKKARVHPDYHIEIDAHYYSVPYTLIREVLEVRVTADVVECFHKSVRVASHRRSYVKGAHTTLTEHMPPRHRHMNDWNPDRIAAWAAKTGVHTKAYVQALMARKRHPQQGFRACLGVIRLGTKFGAARLEAACDRALRAGAFSSKSVRAILENGLDKMPVDGAPVSLKPVRTHANVRGAKYFQLKLEDAQ
jgi:transposase